MADRNLVGVRHTLLVANDMVQGDREDSGNTLRSVLSAGRLVQREGAGWVSSIHFTLNGACPSVFWNRRH